jgi:hypothetical protein
MPILLLTFAVTLTLHFLMMVCYQITADRYVHVQTSSQTLTLGAPVHRA